MKKLALLLVAALIVTLFTVSCSKDSSTSEEVKPFSFTENLELISNSAVFSGTLANYQKLTELYLLLKDNEVGEYERIEVPFGSSQFSITKEELNNSMFSYYYEYVLDGKTKTTSRKEFNTNYPITIVGRWSDNGKYPYFEEYSANGEGKWWGGIDEIPEDEALLFDWYFDENSNMTQIHHYQGGQADIPQYCNILVLNYEELRYNNDGWRQEYDLFRINTK